MRAVDNKFVENGFLDTFIGNFKFLLLHLFWQDPEQGPLIPWLV